MQKNFHLVEPCKIYEVKPVSPLGRTFFRDLAVALNEVHNRLKKYEKRLYSAAHGLTGRYNYKSSTLNVKSGITKLDKHLGAVDSYHEKLSVLKDRLDKHPLSGLDEVPKRELQDLTAIGEITRPILEMLGGIGDLFADLNG